MSITPISANRESAEFENKRVPDIIPRRTDDIFKDTKRNDYDEKMLAQIQNNQNIREMIFKLEKELRRYQAMVPYYDKNGNTIDNILEGGGPELNFEE